MSTQPERAALSLWRQRRVTRFEAEVTADDLDHTSPEPEIAKQTL